MRFLSALFLYAAFLLAGVSGIILGTEMVSIFAGRELGIFLPFAAVLAASLLVLGICLIRFFRFAPKDLIYLAIFFASCVFSGVVLASGMLARAYLLVFVAGGLFTSGIFTWRKMRNALAVRAAGDAVV